MDMSGELRDGCLAGWATPASENETTSMDSSGRTAAERAAVAAAEGLRGSGKTAAEAEMGTGRGRKETAAERRGTE